MIFSLWRSRCWDGLSSPLTSTSIFVVISGLTMISSSLTPMIPPLPQKEPAACWSARRDSPGWLCASRGTIFPGTAPGLLLTSTSWLRC